MAKAQLPPLSWPSGDTDQSDHSPYTHSGTPNSEADQFAVKYNLTEFLKRLQLVATPLTSIRTQSLQTKGSILPRLTWMEKEVPTERPSPTSVSLCESSP